MYQLSDPFGDNLNVTFHSENQEYIDPHELKKKILNTDELLNSIEEIKK